MSHVPLQGALEALYGAERRRDKFGLEGTRALLAALGSPERRFRAVHVAGTNGKGSTCALIERALREAGHRTGLFTSPHLVDFRERIRVSGRWIDEAWAFETLERIARLPAGRDATFFEVTTALAFLWFAETNVEWAVVEVGLGGRLDSTNVLTPELCAITGIGLDHTELLGETLAAIAREKAGIIKLGVPVVVGGGIDAGARAVIAAVAAGCGAPVVDAADYARLGGVAPMLGRNVPVARAALATLAARGVRLPEEAIEAGFALARWPGRLERCGSEPRLWWDGAHNPAGIFALVEAWRGSGVPAPLALVIAVARDKSLDGMLAPLAGLAPGAALIATRTRSERALDAAALAARARVHGFAAREAPDVAAACRAALALPATRETGPVLLTGSLFAVGEAMEAFGGAPGEWQ